MLNPLHTVAPGPEQQPSPYFPSSRCFRNPLYLRIEEVPGATRIDLTEAIAAGRALNESPVIDRGSVYELKMSALERIFEHWRDDGRFADYRAERGPL